MNHRWIIVAVSLTILAACGPKRVGLLSEEGVSIRGNNASLVESSAGKVVMKNIDYGTNGFAHNTPDLVTIGAQYCDVISYNRYAFTTDSVELPDGVDKPVMIGEFHFGAMDRGMFHCSLIEVETQERRAEAYVRYVESALRHPNIIGVHWHQYSDQATTGRFDGENFQVGFTDVCDTPYPETVAGIRKVGYRMYDIRNGK